MATDSQTAIQQYQSQKAIPLIPQAVKNYLCPLAEDSEIALFIELCKYHNINPFIKEAYLIKYDKRSPAQMVVSKDFFTKKADAQDDLKKLEAGVILTNKKEELIYRVGALVLPGENLVGGWAEIIRNGRDPYRNEVSLSEYNAGQASWKKIPATMIRKVALVQTLRESYPNVFQGLYDKAEMDQALPQVEPIEKTQKEVILNPAKLSYSPNKAPSIHSENKTKYPKIPEYQIQEPQWEFDNASDFQLKLLEFASKPEFVFPPTDYARLHECASDETRFKFIIRDKTFSQHQWTHYPGNDGSLDFLRVKITEKNKDDYFVTLYIDNWKGQLLISKPTSKQFGPHIEDYLKPLGYGINFWLVEDTVYEKVTQEKQKEAS